MIVRDDIEQGTQEWLDLRRGKVTGSTLKDLYGKQPTSLKELKGILDRHTIPHTGPERGFEGAATIAKLLTILPKEERDNIEARIPFKEWTFQVIADRLTNKEPDLSPDELMQRGHDNESTMLEHLKAETKRDFQPGRVWESKTLANFMVSPDAECLDAKGKIVAAGEFKSPLARKHCKMLLRNTYLPEYHLQLLSYFICNPDLETLYFVSYNSYFKKQDHRFRLFTIQRADMAIEIAQISDFIARFDTYVSNVVEDFGVFQGELEEEEMPF